MIRSVLFAGIASVFIVGCGGGGGGSSPAPAPGPAPTGTSPPPPAAPIGITASGIVTGFSSVFINGVKYEVENGTIVAIEDEAEVSGDDSLLRIGMKVSVQANEGSGERVAERIEYDDDLKGPAADVVADTLDPSIGTFSVMRQSVLVDTNTIFDNNIGDNNADGNIDIRDLSLSGGSQLIVEISGLPIADGFLATRIERADGVAGDPDVAQDEFEVKGYVTAVAPDGSSFAINQATFGILQGAGGTEFNDGLQNDNSLLGLFVEVKADIDSAGEFIAVRVEREDAFGDRNGDGQFDADDRTGEFEMKAILISVDTAAEPNLVVIGGVTLQVTNASSLTGLTGTLIELKGTFNDSGVLVLSDVSVEVENSVRTEDRVAAIDLGAGTMTTRLGIVVTPTGSSRVEDDVTNDDSGDHLTPAQFLATLQIDDFIEARGFPNGADGISWTRIERENEDDQDCRLRGPVASIDGADANDFSFIIQGVTIDVSQILSDNGFKGSSDQTIGRQAFFDQLNVGDVVQATSDQQGLGCENGRLTANEVEFELDDGVVGSGQDSPNDDGFTDNTEDNITGTPTAVTANTFDLGDRSITVVGSTLIDDSIIEAALGVEFDGGDRRFDQVPAGLTLGDLLPGSFPISVDVTSDSVALKIEDL